MNMKKIGSSRATGGKVRPDANASAEVGAARAVPNGATSETGDKAKRKPIRHHDTSEPVSTAVAEFLSKYGGTPRDYWYEGEKLIGYATTSAAQPSIICLKPISVVALLVDAATGLTVARVKFLDLSDSERHVEVPLSTLASRVSEASAGLAERGVPLMDVNALRYLMLQAALPDVPRVAMLRHLGFSFEFDPANPERIVYAEAGRVLMPDASFDSQRLDAADEGAWGEALCVDHSLALHTDTPDAQMEAYGQTGTLEDWKKVVAQAEGNDLFVFALCVAFGGLINPLHGGEGAIKHCYGESSTGKTTALQLCGSVFGLAADPIRSSVPTVVGGWNMTGNGMELIASSLSGICLTLDELGSLLSVLDIYNAVNGMSKTRMSRDLGFTRTRRWTLFAFSTGEKSIEQHVRDTVRRAMKTGEKVRGIDIPSGPMLETCPHSDEVRRQRADSIKAGLEQCGGSAAPVFAQRLMNLHPTATALRALIRELVDDADKGLVEQLEKDGYVLNAPQRRIVHHFAGILVGGWLAVDTQVLPLCVEDVEGAVFAATRSWLEQENAPDEATLAIRDIRDYVLRHRGEIRDVEHDSSDPRQCFGLLHKGLLLLTHRQFEQACGAQNSHYAKQALRDAGILKHEPGKLTYRVNIQELGFIQTQFVALHYGRLFSEGEALAAEMEEFAGEAVA